MWIDSRNLQKEQEKQINTCHRRTAKYIRRIEEKRRHQKEKKSKRRQKDIDIREEENTRKRSKKTVKAQRRQYKKDITEEKKKGEQINGAVVCTISCLCWEETSSRDPREESQ